MNVHRLVVGVGSFHGDDRVGWMIAQQVGEIVSDQLTVRCARTPAELLDWLDGVDELDICDAVVSADPIGTICSWQSPAPEIESVRFSGSHDLSLPAVLALAERLGRLPPLVRVWGVVIDEAVRFGPTSPAVIDAVPGIARQICGALSHA